jgi:hypothetical protein
VVVEDEEEKLVGPGPVDVPGSVVVAASYRSFVTRESVCKYKYFGLSIVFAFGKCQHLCCCSMCVSQALCSEQFFMANHLFFDHSSSRFLL